MYYPIRYSSLAAAVVLHASVCVGQDFRNLDFSQRCDTCKTSLAHWALSWAGSGTTCGPDAVRNGDPALRIANAGDAVGFVEQPGALPEGNGAMILTVSARVRCTDVVGKGTGLNIGVYAANGALLMNKDMGFGSFSWLTGTQEWRTMRLKIICPAEARSIKLGAILYGKGEAWFDDYVVTSVPMTGRKASARAESYIQTACDTIARRSLMRDSIDLPALRATALMIAGPDDDPTDHHLAVEYLLARLGDHHSFLMKPEEVKVFEGDGPATAIEYAEHRIIKECGYISVPGFASADSLLMFAFADTIQAALGAMEIAGIKGWMVDLRQNTGGNMAPMVCGLGPLFDPGPLGQLVDVDGKAESWYYRAGEYGWDGVAELRMARPVTLKRALPIAVLWSQQTGSSGECTAISFIGNSRTRSFGQPTWGLTTGNGNFDLPDGARMMLASTIMADRKGRTFHGPISPDVVVEQPADWSYDAALQAALDWINEHR